MLKNILFKYGLILFGFFIIHQLLILFTYSPEDITTWQIVNSTMQTLSLVLTIYCCFAAHREFYLKNDRYLSYQNAYRIGFFILVISYLLNFIVASLFYKLFFEKIKHSEQGISGLIQLFSSPIEPHLFATSFNGFHISQLLFDLKQILISFSLWGLIILIYFESRCMIFYKADKKPWAALIPFYGMVVLLEVVEKPKWWFFLLLLPFLNIYLYIIIVKALSEKFGKSSSFTPGLLFLPFLYFPKLGLSKLEFNPA